MFYSKIHAWCIQRIASLGLVSFFALLYLALWHDRPEASRWSSHTPNSGEASKPEAASSRELTRAQWVLLCYTIIAHLLALGFPIRLCWATFSITKRLKSTIPPRIPSLRPKRYRSSTREEEKDDGLDAYDASSSSSSISSILSDSTDESSPERGADEILLHTVIIPNYKEELDTLRETLEVLASHPIARESYEICLAMEQGESEAESKAVILIKEFSGNFRDVDFTIHPSGIPGEAQGKSSNLCWAAKYVNGKHVGQRRKRNMIITVIDSDSHLSLRYFESINEMHDQDPQTAHSTLYVPPIIFDRNAHLVPTLVRVADILWAGAGLSGHYKSSSICPPTSVYSMSLALVDKVGGWDAGVETIGEDLHMYIKCFFALNGNLTTRTILSPASHSNVHTGDPGIRGFVRDIRARYRQALRHMWGALDSGFVIKSTSMMLWERRLVDDEETPHWSKTIVLIHRMYEAHFLPTHITLLIIAGGLYTLLVPATAIPPRLLFAFNLTGWLRLGSALTFAFFFYLYEDYHAICVARREKGMVRAGLSDRMAGFFSHRTRRNAFDFCFFPVAGMLYGTVPTVVALVWQLWTLDLVYSVSKKPLWAAAVATA